MGVKGVNIVILIFNLALGVSTSAFRWSPLRNWSQVYPAIAFCWEGLSPTRYKNIWCAGYVCFT